MSHYAKLDDRQKLEAAQYLIRYMPYHTSYDKGIEDYYHAIDSVVALSEDKLEQENISNRFVLDLKVNINRNGI